MTEIKFKNNPELVVSNFLNSIDQPPHESYIDRAAEILDASVARDALGVCIDLSADRILVMETTPTLARMLQENHRSIPQRWRANTEIWRTLLEMTANADLGFIRARIKHESRDGKTDQLIQKAENLQRFIDSLEEQVGQGLGEMGNRRQTRK